MALHSLTSVITKRKRRLGQGHGSGRVKTSGRGTKGQKARTKIPLRFEGGALPLIKRMPFRRGKEKNKVFKNKPIIINLSALSVLSKTDVVNLETLIKQKIVDKDKAETHGVKILGNGEVTQAFTVHLPVSQSAKSKIEKAGGSIQVSS